MIQISTRVIWDDKEKTTVAEINKCDSIEELIATIKELKKFGLMPYTDQFEETS